MFKYLLQMKKHVIPKTMRKPVMPQNHQSVSPSCPGTSTFMPHMPVTMFIGRTIVPRTVSLPSTSLVCSARSFIRMLICAR